VRARAAGTYYRGCAAHGHTGGARGSLFPGAGGVRPLTPTARPAAQAVAVRLSCADRCGCRGWPTAAMS
jgi:hypothetical protein